MYPFKKNKTAAMVEENGVEKILIRFSYQDDYALYENIKMLPNRRYDKEKEYWIAPLKLETLESLIKWGFTLDSKLLSLQEILKKELNDLISAEIIGLKGQLFPYQREGVAFIERCNGRALISDETGLGKTIQALAWLQKHPEKRPVVIVVPSSLKLNWKNEIERWMSNPKVEFLTGSPTSWRHTGEIIITSYDEVFAWVNKLNAINIQVLILDEINYIKDKSTNQTKAVKKLGKDISHIICLAGMSIAAHPVEAYTAIKLINPELFPSFADYSKRYGNTKPNYFGWESYGASPSKTSFAFEKSEEKLKEFMKWLQEQVNKGLIEIREFEQLGDGIEAEWTNKYIADSFKRKEIRTRSELAKAGIKVPSNEQTESAEISMSTPFHIDRVGLLFTRVFANLPGITDAMDAVISRILAQGMADGDGPALLARKLEASINGAGLGDLGITNSFIADTINQHISAKRRAKMLVHTEMMSAYHRSTIQEYRNWANEGVFVKAEWVTGGDNRVCDLCNAMEGKIFSLDEIEGMIPLHPECRCTTIPYLEELKKYENKPKEEEDWLGLREGINTRKSHIPELYKILTGTIMIRRLKKDALIDLPNQIYSFIPFEIDNKKEYDEAEKNFVHFFKGENKSELTVRDRNTATFISFESLLLISEKGKLKQTIEWVKNILEVGNKLVVFTSHKFIIENLIQAFPKVSVKIGGSANDKERKEKVDDFQTNPNVRLLVGDLQEAESGITLTSVSNIAFLELPVSLGEMTQIADLCKKTRPKDNVNIYYLFAAGTIEERIVKIIDNKNMGIDSVFEGSQIKSSLFLNELIKEFK